MLTGNDSLQEDSAPVDFETGTTGLSFEIGSNIETFASVDAYADWLVAQASARARLHEDRDDGDHDEEGGDERAERCENGIRTRAP